MTTDLTHQARIAPIRIQARLLLPLPMCAALAACQFGPAVLETTMTYCYFGGISNAQAAAGPGYAFHPGSDDQTVTDFVGFGTSIWMFEPGDLYPRLNWEFSP